MWIQTVVSLLGFSVIPWAVLCGGDWLLLRAQARRPERFASVVGQSLVDSALLTLAFMAWATVVILTSTSSTAPIGFVFLPMNSFAVALLTFAAAWSLHTLSEATRGRARGPVATIGATIVIVGIVSGGAYAWHCYTWLSEAASVQTPPPRLAVIAQDALSAHDYETLERLTAVAEALANDPDGSVRMWVPRNPKLSHATLERLAADPDPNVRSQANAAMTGSES